MIQSFVKEKNFNHHHKFSHACLQTGWSQQCTKIKTKTDLNIYTLTVSVQANLTLEAKGREDGKGTLKKLTCISEEAKKTVLLQLSHLLN